MNIAEVGKCVAYFYEMTLEYKDEDDQENVDTIKKALELPNRLFQKTLDSFWNWIYSRVK